MQKKNLVKKRVQNVPIWKYLQWVGGQNTYKRKKHTHRYPAVAEEKNFAPKLVDTEGAEGVAHYTRFFFVCQFTFPRFSRLLRLAQPQKWTLSEFSRWTFCRCGKLGMKFGNFRFFFFFFFFFPLDDLLKGRISRANSRLAASDEPPDEHTQGRWPLHYHRNSKTFAPKLEGLCTKRPLRICHSCLQRWVENVLRNSRAKPN